MEIVVGADAGLADEDRAVWDLVGQCDGVADVGVHPRQVAVVDAQETRCWGCGLDNGEDPAEVLGRVDLDKGRHPLIMGYIDAYFQEGGVETLGDEKDGVGAGGTAFEDLPRVDDEVFAEDWEVGGVFDGIEERELAAEGGLVCEATDGGRSGVGVGPGDAGWVEARAGVGVGRVVFGSDEAGGGALAFDLGDDAGG